MAKERLDKVLANMGYGTRKEVKALCKKGLVLVNGDIVKDSSVHVDPENDTIEVDGEVLKYKKYIYVMLNKPQGVISATEDDFDETVVDILPDEFKIFKPSPVGRLDKDTEGLLILTNDGELNHLLLSPRRHVPKKYYAKVKGVVTQEDVEKFKEGVVLDDGYKTMPAELTILKSDEISEIELVIYEGKYHQVKRMFEAVGKKVVYLKRIEMGPLKLDDSLELGECRELTDDEVQLLYNAVKK
ncbi:pseudouridine synthase [Thermobrachium celere]|uniref:Pseudouridine synthase n=1 Tax=Thermobrachium celere DSM 8682 TaxID=941824 RepID=R7RTW2_9CLOT|nr:pseudouridine synthase [Thermobrachium celere]GFR36079.1 pseudouridine synthase [Thermobrachium celere]CDF59469.1 Ribosomal small subunit pseudouridine synthase A [Thermobrachium celere DSM 8682]